MLGFSMQMKRKGGYWYALRRINGTLHQVYVGKRLSDAETKISEYCKKKNLKLPPVVAVTSASQENAEKILAELARAKKETQKLNGELKKLREIWNDEFDLETHTGGEL